MPERAEPDVFAAIRVMEVSLIDGGRTDAVGLEKADMGEAVILLSRAVCDDLQHQLQAALSDPGSVIAGE